jgi:quercetin dioxygenase-like cupin family protein
MSVRSTLAGSILALALTGSLTSAQAEFATGGEKLLSVEFEARAIEQVEVGDFHFPPGQLAPVHTHAAPAIGYVSKGTIYYQVEGQAPQLLKTGDAFYEPVGPRILHFDNASQTEEAVFTDFNLERKGEPFIVFPAPLKVKIDRRTFPTTKLDGRVVDKVEASSEVIAAGASQPSSLRKWPILSYMASGEVDVVIGAEAALRIKAGQTFSLPAGSTPASIKNISGSEGAKVVSFHLMSTKGAN